MLKLIRTTEGAIQLTACSPLRGAKGKTIRMRRSNINALARMQVYSTPLKEELIAEARFRFDLFAGFPSALGR